MISVINPSQFGAFPRSSGVVQYPDFYSSLAYHMNTERQSSNSMGGGVSSSSGTTTSTTSSTGVPRGITQYPNPSSTSSNARFFEATSGRLPIASSSTSSSSSSSTSSDPPPRGLVHSNPSKDYSKPLFVDCSIEYELPNAPKIPKNSQPILMIHPTYQKKLIAAQQIQLQRSSPCTGPHCRQCQEESMLLKKSKGDTMTTPERKASKRTYSAIENIFKNSFQGKSDSSF